MLAVGLWAQNQCHSVARMIAKPAGGFDVAAGVGTTFRLRHKVLCRAGKSHYRAIWRWRPDHLATAIAAPTLLLDKGGVAKFGNLVLGHVHTSFI